MLKAVGYWNDKGKGSWLDPNLLIGRFSRADKPRVLRYLNAGLRINDDLGYSYCRIADGPPPEGMGSADRTDGAWVWPEGLSVYVEQFDIALPEAFLDHVVANEYEVPQDLDLDHLDNTSFDFSFWEHWCRGMELLLGRRSRLLGWIDFLRLQFRARILGDMVACDSLGAAYATGDGFLVPVEKNQEIAFRWYSRAARGGIDTSQYELGFLYLNGQGVPKDNEEGLRWMVAAAEQGYCEAIRVLADVYASGAWGIGVDEELARAWADRLAAHLERHPEDRRKYEREAGV